MMRFSLATAALLVALRGAAGQDRLDLQGTDAETAAKVAEIAASATNRGLPAGAVINEARFAALYKVPGERIVLAARGVADRLGVAREALQPDPSARDIEAGAEALKYGISANVLRDIRKSSKGPVAVPIGLLIQLVAEPNKMQVKRASAIVLDLVKRGADTRMIAELGNAVNADVALGMTPDKSLAFHLNALQPLLGAPGGSAAAADALQSGTMAGPRKKP
jgi:hypothetical protein